MSNGARSTRSATSWFVDAAASVARIWRTCSTMKLITLRVRGAKWRRDEYTTLNGSLGEGVSDLEAYLARIRSRHRTGVAGGRASRRFGEGRRQLIDPAKDQVSKLAS
ncbi:protein of unknown function [Bradyrhizobium vignae]|uniref:Uncharacterized protein n=1 Tax=Bradyrhizobium vignae TaxID=1549949 RepID=A0A2U3Q720_9BRAD|nr:protein of unknown function [Bradyrhizobium vignae]